MDGSEGARILHGPFPQSAEPIRAEPPQTLLYINPYSDPQALDEFLEVTGQPFFNRYVNSHHELNACREPGFPVRCVVVPGRVTEAPPDLHVLETIFPNRYCLITQISDTRHQFVYRYGLNLGRLEKCIEEYHRITSNDTPHQYELNSAYEAAASNGKILDFTPSTLKVLTTLHTAHRKRYGENSSNPLLHMLRLVPIPLTFYESQPFYGVVMVAALDEENNGMPLVISRRAKTTAFATRGALRRMQNPGVRLKFGRKLEVR